MGQTNYRINEYGEIVRENQFSPSANGATPQVLPTNRKAWKIWLLSCLTFGIYGLVVLFTMAKETNISCANDGKHTRGFWGMMLLSVVTLGIYSYVWCYKWIGREYEYLSKNRSQGGMLSGGGFLFLMLISFILSFASQYVYQENVYQIYYGGLEPILMLMLIIFYVAQVIWGIYVMYRMVNQHNTVNQIYNQNVFGQEA